MKAQDYVVYRGEKFYVQSTGRYFSCRSDKNGDRLLHRRIWSDANGPIPENMVVHHKDGDWRNNDLSNLELMELLTHCSMHMNERWQKDSEKSVFYAGLEKAREAAKSWHSSEEGLAWHRMHGKESWSSKTRQPLTCQCCGDEFMGHPSAGAMFCSKACQQKAVYKNRFTLPATCSHCGTSFVTSRYRPTTFCSRTCSNRARFSAKKEPIHAEV